MSNENSLRLFMSARSPFARRVRLAMKRQKREVEEVSIDVYQNNPELERFNPQGAVPTLVLADGSGLSGSANILEYLGIFPADFSGRQASQIAEGIMQSAVLYHQEKAMHEVPSERWLMEHLSCLRDSFAFVQQCSPVLWIQNHELTQAGWDLAVAIEYIECRVPEVGREKHYPELNAVLEVARKNQFFSASKPQT